MEEIYSMISVAFVFLFSVPLASLYETSIRDKVRTEILQARVAGSKICFSN